MEAFNNNYNDNNNNNNANLHTLILMNNPNLALHHHHHHQQLLNSAATAASFSHQYARLPPPDNNNVTLYGYPQEEARDTSRARQGLSLTLSSENHRVAQPADVADGGGQVSVLGSKYLRATQELLEEVVNVGDNTSNDNDHSSPSKKGKGVGDTQSDDGDKLGVGSQLGTAERHEVQMKKAKLVSMLDEAEQRYRQYNHQIQMVIESFERAAGMESAKTYTALALKTISKQFRCLRDAIQGQIRAANKSLGEDEGGSGLSCGKIEGSRLKFIDHQIRQQRALQQLGMIQNHNAWRPQRGLPERSVSVLRAWLFEHFLHPYPKDSDKILLAKQTGLTRSQVSNWFINARVRLWKPMIEEMYNEELKEQEKSGSDEKAITKENTSNNESTNEQANISNIAETQVKSSQLLDQHNNGVNPSSSFMSIPMNSGPNYNHQGFTLNGSFELEGISQGSPKRQRSNEMLSNGEILIKFGNDEKQQKDGEYPIISGGMNFMGGGGLGLYPNMGDLGRFETEDFSALPRFLQGNGGISLSLGLPPSNENNQQQHFNNLSGTSHTFIPPSQNIHQFRRGSDFGSMSNPASNAGFECIDIQNRKGFAAQLLPDYVA